MYCDVTGLTSDFDSSEYEQPYHYPWHPFMERWQTKKVFDYFLFYTVELGQIPSWVYTLFYILFCIAYFLQCRTELKTVLRRQFFLHQCFIFSSVSFVYDRLDIRIERVDCPRHSQWETTAIYLSIFKVLDDPFTQLLNARPVTGSLISACRTSWFKRAGGGNHAIPFWTPPDDGSVALGPHVHS